MLQTQNQQGAYKHESTNCTIRYFAFLPFLSTRSARYVETGKIHASSKISSPSYVCFWLDHFWPV